MDKPMIRINYSSKYHTGSYPILNYDDAITFIIYEFGKGGNITYPMKCLRTEIAEMIFDACREMENSKLWVVDNDMNIHKFVASYE